MVSKDVVEEAEEATIVIFQTPHIPRLVIGVACQILSPLRLQRVEEWESKQHPQHLIGLAFELDWTVVKVDAQPNEIAYIVDSTLWE